MKLTQAQTRDMAEVERLVALDRRLKDDEREYVLDHYQEGATQNNTAIGAFFTPQRLARDLNVEVGDCRTIVDLCAGIGSLAFACEERAERIVCVESSAEYVRVGRKVMPDATWIHADVFSDWWTQFARFDYAISNPPFGRIKAPEFQGRYTGSDFEYKVIELASRVARNGTFIVPQKSAPFRYSGCDCYREAVGDECRKFMDQTGITLGNNCGIDTSQYLTEWHGVSPMCEIVLADFDGVVAPGQQDLFAAFA